MEKSRLEIEDKECQGEDRATNVNEIVTHATFAQNIFFSFFLQGI